MSGYYIGRQQLTLMLRSKWLISFGLLFVLLAFFVTYFSQTGDAGFDGFNRMTASLLNLNLLMVPLISLLMGSLFLAGEKEDSGLLLLLTYPVSTGSVLAGKYFGLYISLAAVITCGYGAALLPMYVLNSAADFGVIIKFYALSLLLAAIFVAVSVFIGIQSRSRFQALGISLIVWAASVLFYEFILMAVTLFLPSQSVLAVLTASVFLNPVEIIRVWAILSMDGASVFGPSLYEMTVWASGWQGTAMFIISIILWTVLPLFICSRLLKRGIEND